MTIFLGTFPYKLWELINSPQDNGIQWCKEGKMIRIEKKLFQKKCLNKRNFATLRFISITKQFNVYGFVQQAHMDTDRYLIYKHINFVQGHPELLRNMTRRIKCKKSYYKTKELSQSVCIQSPKKMTKFDPVLQARLHFKFVLRDNVDQVLKLPTGDTSSDDECGSNRSSDSKEVVFPSIKPPVYAPPPRHDPTTLMWNGLTNQPHHPLYPNLYYPVPPVQHSYPCPRTDCNNQTPETLNPPPVYLISACSNQDSKHQYRPPPEDEGDLDFGLESGELQEIFLDRDFQVIYEEIIENC